MKPLDSALKYMDIIYSGENIDELTNVKNGPNIRDRSHWGWYYLASVMDDYSRYSLSRKLFSTMSADDVRETLAMAVAKTGGTKVHVRHRPRLLSDNGPCYLSHELKDYLDTRGINTLYPWSTLSPADAGKDRTVSSIDQDYH